MRYGLSPDSSQGLAVFYLPDLRRPVLTRRVVARCATVLLFLGCAVRSLTAQDIAPPPPRGGLQIRSVSAYFDYYSAALPTGGGLQPSAKLLSDGAGGASVQVGWVKFSDRTTASFMYTSSVTGHARYSEWNAWNHAFSFNTSHKLAGRWTFGVAASGDFSTQEQSLFSSTTLSNVASVRSNFDDLASAMLTSKFTNPQLASALTSAPLVDSPLRNLLYGQRMFTLGVQSSLSHSYSPRLSVSFQAGGGRSQHVSENQQGANRNSYLIPDTTSANAGMTVSYSLSRHTQLGGSVTANRIFSSLQDAYTTTSLATLGRTLTRRWILQIHGGVGVTKPVRQISFRVSTAPHPAGGGSLVFKTLSQTVLGSFEHTVSDSYGLGAAATSAAGASWRWRRPGRSWWLESSASWEQLHGNALGNTSGWHTTGGLGRIIGAQVVLLAQYAYQNYSGRLQNTLYSQDQSSVRLSLVWSPHPETSR